MENSVIVRVYGRQLDQLRAEASRIARESKIDWWIERGRVGIGSGVGLGDPDPLA
jgi:hypothetical protein